MNAVGALSSHFLNAKEINIGQTYSGKVRAASSEYFKFNTEETGIVTFDYTYTDNDYSKVHLYDSEGEELFFSFSIRVNENGVAHGIGNDLDHITLEEFRITKVTLQKAIKCFSVRFSP